MTPKKTHKVKNLTQLMDGKFTRYSPMFDQFYSIYSWCESDGTIKIIRKNHPQLVRSVHHWLRNYQPLSQLNIPWEKYASPDPLFWQNIMGDNMEEKEVFNAYVQWNFARLKDSSPERITIQHWISFLSPIAIKCAQKTSKNCRFNHSLSYGEVYQTSLSVAFTCISPVQVFSNFNLREKYGRSLAEQLQGFAYRKIIYSMYPHLRVEYQDPNLGRTDINLPLRYSGKLIQEALIISGIFNTGEIERINRICKYVKRYLNLHNLTIDGINEQGFQEIAQSYQEQGFDNLPPPNIVKTLQLVGSQIRFYMSPKYNSLNSHLTEDGKTEFIEVVSDRDSSTSLEVDGEENRLSRVDIAKVLERILNDLSAYERDIIWLADGLNINQVDIAKLLLTHRHGQGKISKDRRQVLINISEKLHREFSVLKPSNYPENIKDKIKATVQLLQGHLTAKIKACNNIDDLIVENTTIKSPFPKIILAAIDTIRHKSSN